MASKGTKESGPPTAPPKKPPTSGGGGGGGGGSGPPQPKPAFVVVDDEKVWKQRKPFIEDEDFGFNPGSLVGSWFHRLENDRIVWQGAVVAEPQPGSYLLEIDTLDVGAKNVQRLISLEMMLNDDEGYDWRFYDDEERAKTAYREWVATERERA
jgi:hypothetical protein